MCIGGKIALNQFENLIHLPGHASVLHSRSSTSFPSQSSPAYLGNGSLQSLYLLCFPEPQACEQGVTSDQSLNAPLTGALSIRW